MSSPVGGPPYGRPPQQPYYPAPPPRGNGALKWVLGCGGLAALVLILLVGCSVILTLGSSGTTDAPTSTRPSSEGSAASTDTKSEEPSAEPRIVLKATATGEGRVSYGGSEGSSDRSFTGEWTHEVSRDGGEYLYLHTHNGNFMDESGEVTCQILVDGEVKSEGSGSGSAGFANCDVFVPFF